MWKSVGCETKEEEKNIQCLNLTKCKLLASSCWWWRGMLVISYLKQIFASIITNEKLTFADRSNFVFRFPFLRVFFTSTIYEIGLNLSALCSLYVMWNGRKYLEYGKTFKSYTKKSSRQRERSFLSFSLCRTKPTEVYPCTIHLNCELILSFLKHLKCFSYSLSFLFRLTFSLNATKYFAFKKNFIYSAILCCFCSG